MVIHEFVNITSGRIETAEDIMLVTIDNGSLCAPFPPLLLSLVLSLLLSASVDRKHLATHGSRWTTTDATSGNVQGAAIRTEGGSCRAKQLRAVDSKVNLSLLCNLPDIGGLTGNPCITSARLEVKIIEGCAGRGSFCDDFDGTNCLATL